MKQQESVSPNQTRRSANRERNEEESREKAVAHGAKMSREVWVGGLSKENEQEKPQRSMAPAGIRGEEQEDELGLGGAGPATEEQYQAEFGSAPDGYFTSPERVTDDELFGEDSEDDRLIKHAMKEFEDVEELPEAGGELVDVEEGEEKKKVLRDPGEPTAEEYEAHRSDHMPYRSWCPRCVKGRATGRQHRHQEETHSIPQFGFDYLHGTESIESNAGEDEVVKILSLIHI